MPFPYIPLYYGNGSADADNGYKVYIRYRQLLKYDVVNHAVVNDDVVKLAVSSSGGHM